MKTKLFGVALGLGLLGFGLAPTASAQHNHAPGQHHAPQPQPPQYAGYGNGAHDLDPHWHTKQTPFGNYAYFGNGRHDLRPHDHTVSPHTGVTSYSNGPFRSTQSYNGFPGGYGGYRGGYGNGFGGSPYGYGGQQRGFSFRFGGW